MTKIAISLSIVLCLLGLAYGFHHMSLARFNISFKPPSVTPGCKVADLQWLQKRKFLYSLSRVDSKNIVAIVEGRTDGTIELNPRHKFGLGQLDYGPIPATQALSRRNTDTLFGPVKEENKDYCTYSLMIRSGLPETNNKVILLDLRFRNSLLHQFRIRSNEVNSFDWVTVKEEREEA
ncbi:MAG: hypothetical protein KC777_05065 [Cyanobacteria bacterium HKST-UBA02]|nr:hypothetical protein [Cyanobacteria bacterium HKST-UBA02]